MELLKPRGVLGFKPGATLTGLGMISATLVVSKKYFSRKRMVKNGEINLPTPIGVLQVLFDKGKVSKVHFLEEAYPEPDRKRDKISEAFEAYFQGDTEELSKIPLLMQGSPKMIEIREKMREIPLGETRFYSELGPPRLVARACSSNPIPLLIPCHRVVPKSGGIGEYGEGVWRKRWLLDHEKNAMLLAKYVNLGKRRQNSWRHAIISKGS